jgi:hypothetical protein
LNDTGTRELIFVLALMGVLLVLGVVACVIFYRVWRKEKKK